MEFWPCVEYDYVIWKASPDFFAQLSKPQKVLIPERYVELEPEEPLSPQEMEDRHRKVERIKSILAKSRFAIWNQWNKNKNKKKMKDILYVGIDIY